MGQAPEPEDDLTLRARARVGQVLKDKWRLDRLLGVGGMAAVYAATHRNASRVAVKMLHVELSLDKVIRGRFLREGYVANTVDHPGAVRVLDDDVADDGSVFLVMDLLQGETLAARAQRAGGPLPAVEVLSIAEQVLDVLSAAHERGIVHRDIKPDNVFLTQEGSVRVLDFGIARMHELAGGTAATKTGSMMGTPAFMPPEQALGHANEVDARSDLWAVGATMFALLSGRYVHPADTANEQMIRAATTPAPPLGSVAPGLSPMVSEIVDRALAFERADRWPSARAMKGAVRGALRELRGREDEPIVTRPLGSPEPAASAPDHTVPMAGRPIVAAPHTLGDAAAMSRTEPGHAPISRRGVLLAAIGAGCVVVVGLALWLFGRSGPEPSPIVAPAAVSSPAPPLSAEIVATADAAPVEPPSIAASVGEAPVSEPAASATKARPTPRKGPASDSNWLRQRK
jgi:serine/threonine-protein kinase